VDRGAAGGPVDARFRSVLEHQAARARVFFSRATRALPPVERRGLVAAEIMRTIYWDLLLRIEQAGCDVFSQVIRVPKPVQARLALATWWRSTRAAPSQ
jgi:phytoene synthase